MITEVRKTVDVILTKPSRSSRFDLAQVSEINIKAWKFSDVFFYFIFQSVKYSLLIRRHGFSL